MWHSYSQSYSDSLLLYRQNVVIVGAGRTSRSARIATSSELLYLLNLLYNMPSDCCDEYKLIQLHQKSSMWCFAFSHTPTFELIPTVATAQPGAVVQYCKIPHNIAYTNLKHNITTKLASNMITDMYAAIITLR